jgi:adenosylcobinamide-GDP ribazoletransferase
MDEDRDTAGLRPGDTRPVGTGRGRLAFQLILLRVAVQFLTRFPVPPFAVFDPGWITRSARYFPLVGQAVGALSALVLLASGRVWSGALPALLAVAAGVLVTGAFHHDGLADTADGLGGGRDVATRLAIMKDSRIGSYGALALILSLALEVAALGSLGPAEAAIGLVTAHGGGRFAAVLALFLLRPVADRADAKYKPTPEGVRPAELALAALLAVWPFFLCRPSAAAAGLIAGAILAGIVAALARRLLGGYVGDTLGAIEQMFELGCLLGLAAFPGSV